MGEGLGWVAKVKGRWGRHDGVGALMLGLLGCFGWMSVYLCVGGAGGVGVGVLVRWVGGLHGWSWMDG